MPKIQRYYRPTKLSEVLYRITESNTAVLAGGTQLISSGDDIEAVVDLQSMGLDGVETQADGTVSMGAMVRLQNLVENPSVPELVQQMAFREGPNTFRNAGTLGGVIALADWESELYAALLLFEAEVTVHSAAGEQNFPLQENWDLSDGELITAVTIQTTGTTASERVARTPADKPIVALLGRHTEAGTQFAACGLAKKPILLAEADLESLRPPADFRGSSGYRREMARVLLSRVRHRVESGS